MNCPYQIRKKKVTVPLIANIPHSSTFIPQEMNDSFSLSNDDLKSELLKMTDIYTAEIFSCITELGGISVIYTFSRLVLDPERFRNDEKEVMADKGMGVIYTNDSNGRFLRDTNETERNRLLKNLYDPYHNAILKEVKGLLNDFGECLIIDGHSFPAIPLSYETNQDIQRPKICIGTNQFHTPQDLTDFILNFFKNKNLTTEINKPFEGCYVPSEFLGKDKRVKSIMIEINRGLYMNEDTGEKNGSFDEIKNIISTLIRQIITEFFKIYE